MNMKLQGSDLSLFNLTEATIDILRKNKALCNQAAGLIVNGLYEVFFEYRNDILGINYRIKSENSMREKIIRRKLYKEGTTAEEVFGAIPDIIGVMVECEFIENEEPLFRMIESYFNKQHDNGWYCNEKFENLFINLAMHQPITQKNGNQLYKMDCYYVLDGLRINFELQIKSLVNSFWSEVEHNIVYKNNHYLPDDDYIGEMLSAVRMNLLGLDKILHLISSRINALNSYSVMKDIELTDDLITQLVSDLVNNKMMDSLGFTVDVKSIRDLLTLMLKRKSRSLAGEEAFYKYLDRFRVLQNREIDFTKAIRFNRVYKAKGIFKQILGDRLISLMNTDFEWYSFFVMLFHIDGSDPLDCLDDFLSEMEDIYVSDSLFERVSESLSAEDVAIVKNETKSFVAEALCQLSGLGVQRTGVYKKGAEELSGFLSYTLNCTEDIEQWNTKKDAIRSVIMKSL